MKTIQLFTLFLFATISINAQKEIKSIPIAEKIKIDGKLTESVWQQNLEEGNFRQLSPINGKKHSNKTKIAIAYDATFLYVAAKLITPTINKNLTSRDDVGTSDYFGMIIDLFGANREAWAFLITPANVQTDIKITNNGNYSEWNAVWESAVQIHKDSWTIEIKIPFNSLRFPKNNLSNSTINFERFDANTNEDSFWNYVNADVDGLLNQFGKLTGLQNINPPINLSLTPFTSIINEFSPNGNSKTTFNGGLDVKYVYKNAYTFDVSLIPDFSQAPSDDEIFNLSPFEIKYNENRQFFVEGTEIFNKGNYLYTRRIGGTPLNKSNINIAENEEIINNPVRSNILNLIKVTGKSNNGFSVGFLNGLTDKSEAEILNTTTQNIRKEITNPLTNYTSFVLDKTLKNNSSLTFINNTVLRNGNTYDTNFTALLYKWYNSKRTYSMYFKKAFSQKYFSNKDNLFGHEYYGYLGKVSGKWQGSISTRLYDENFDNNDFGFNSRNNELKFRADISFAENNPKNIFSRYRIYVNSLRRYYYSLMEKDLAYYKIGSNGTFKKNNHSFYLEFTFIEKSKNFYEARVKNRYFNKPAQSQTFIEYQTNRNKKVSFAGYLVLVNYSNSSVYTNELIAGYGVRARFGEHLYINFNQSYEDIPNSAGYLTQKNNVIIFGQRNIVQLNNSLNISYTINSKLNISTRIRHYWIKINYNKQYELLENGGLLQSTYSINPNSYDNNFNSFTLDFLTKWQFAPASEMSFGYKLGTNFSNADVNSSYFNNLNTVFKEKSSHTVSLKLTYFIDFNDFYFKKKKALKNDPLF